MLDGGVTVPCMSHKLPIKKVGTVALRSDGTMDASGWEFGAPGQPSTFHMDAEPTAGRLAGWEAVELHAVAHGVPCDCEVAAWLADNGY